MLQVRRPRPFDNNTKRPQGMTRGPLPGAATNQGLGVPDSAMRMSQGINTASVAGGVPRPKFNTDFGVSEGGTFGQGTTVSPPRPPAPAVATRPATTTPAPQSNPDDIARTELFKKLKASGTVDPKTGVTTVAHDPTRGRGMASPAAGGGTSAAQGVGAINESGIDPGQAVAEWEKLRSILTEPVETAPDGAPRPGEDDRMQRFVQEMIGDVSDLRLPMVNGQPIFYHGGDGITPPGWAILDENGFPVLVDAQTAQQAEDTMLRRDAFESLLDFQEQLFLQQDQAVSQQAREVFLRNLDEEIAKRAEGRSLDQQKILKALDLSAQTTLQEMAQEFQASERRAGQSFQETEAMKQRFWQNQQRIYGENFQTTLEQMAQGFQTSEREASQQWQERQDAAQRNWQDQQRMYSEAFQAEQNRLGRDLEIAMFESREGIRIGDFETARRAREQAEALQKGQFALQFLQQITASPEGLLIARQSGLLDMIQQATGLNMAGLMGLGEGEEGGALANADLPTLAEFEKMPFDQRERLLFNLAATMGVRRETIAAEIARRAQGGGLASGGGTGTLRRIPMGA